MNKIFKVIWNAASQSWTVVSELTKAHKKQSAVKNGVKLSVLALALSSGSSLAASSADGLVQINTSSSNAATATAIDGIAIGNKAVSGTNTNVKNTIAVGTQSSAVADGSIAIGEYASIESSLPHTRGVRSIAIGSGASISPTRVATATNYAEDAMAIGTNATASAARAIVIGANASSLRDPNNNTYQTGADTIVIGSNAQSNWNNSIAIGKESRTNMTDAVAIGYQAETAGAYGEGSAAVAIGPQSRSMGAGSSALGNAVSAYGNHSTSIGSNSIAYETNSSAFGYNAISRSANSTALGVSSSTGVSDAQRATAVGFNAHAALTSALAMGDRATAYGVDSTAIGRQATTYGDHSIAIGGGSNASGTAGANSFAVGSRASAIGQDARSMGTHSIAFGQGAIAGGDSELSNAVSTALGKYQTTYNAYVSLQDNAMRKDMDHKTALVHLKSDAQDALVVLRDLSSEERDLITKLTGVDSEALSEAMEMTANGSADEAKEKVSKNLENLTKIAEISNTGLGGANSSLKLLVDKVSAAVASYEVENIELTEKEAAVQNVKDALDEYNAAIQELEDSYKNASGAAIAIGSSANAQQQGSTAIGLNTKAEALNSFAAGTRATAKSTNSVAVGVDSNVGTNSADSLAFGSNAKVSDGVTSGTAIGNQAKSTQNYAVALGYQAEGNGVQTLAMGAGAKANGPSSSAIGTLAQANGDRDVAFGSDAQATAGFGVAVGVSSRSSAQGAAALGLSANASGIMSTALGPGASAAVDRGVALGNRSVADTTVRAGFNQNTISRNSRNVLNAYKGSNGVSIDDKAMTPTLAAVSIGSDTETRQIIHLAAGTADDDAVNVAQLKSVNLQIAGNTTTNDGADVRLWDQGLTVKGKDGSYITTNADNNTIEIDTKKADLTVTNGKADSPVTNDGLVTGQELVNTVNDLYWNARADGSNAAANIKAGNTVTFKGANGLSISQSSDNNGTTFTFTPDYQATVNINGEVNNLKGDDKNITLQPKGDNLEVTLNPTINVDGVNAKDSVNVGPNGETKLTNGKLDGLNGHIDPPADNTVKTDPNTLENNRKEAATLGDVLNAGWNLQANTKAVDGVTHNDTVNFASKDGSVKITSSSDGKTSTLDFSVAAPTVYTDTEGNKLVRVNNNYYKQGDIDANGRPKTGASPVTNVVVSLNTNPDGSTAVAPTQLSNVAAGANTIAYDKDGNALVNINGKYYDPNDVENGQPKAGVSAKDGLTADELNLITDVSPAKKATLGLADLNNSKGSNALTVSDAKNLGWVVSATENDYAKDVRNTNQVNFVGGTGISVTGSTEGDVRTITYNVDLPINYTKVTDNDGNELKKANDGKWYKAGDVNDDGSLKTTTNTDGSITTPTATTVKKEGATLSDDNNTPYKNETVYNYDNNNNATQKPYDASNPAAKDTITKGTGGVQLDNVGWAEKPDQAVNKDQLDQTVNKSGFFVQQNGKSTLATNPDETDATKSEKVTPNDVVDFVDGSNTKVNVKTVRDANGVDKTTVSVDVDLSSVDPSTINIAKGGNTIAYDNDGNQLVNIGGKYYKPEDVTNGQPNQGAKEQAAVTPSATGKPVENAKNGLADLDHSNGDNVITVNDAKNLGWIVSATDENDASKTFANAVKNTDQVDFKGEEGTGVTVKGKIENGVNTITVGNDYTKVNSTSEPAKANGENSIAMGGNSEANGTGSVAIGEGAKVETSAPAGSVAIGPNSTASAAHTGPYSLNGGEVKGKTGSTTRVVSVGKEGDEAQIQNVAPGVVSANSTDAINGSQLHATNVRVNQNTQAIGRLNNKIDNVDKRASRGVAIAGAMGMLPQPHISGKSLVGVATTNFRGEQALAVGYSRLSDNGKHIIKFSGSTNMSGKKDAMVGAAYGYQW